MLSNFGALRRACSTVLLFCCLDSVRVWFALMLELATSLFAHYLCSLSPFWSFVNVTLWAWLLVPSGQRKDLVRRRRIPYHGRAVFSSKLLL